MEHLWKVKPNDLDRLLKFEFIGLVVEDICTPSVICLFIFLYKANGFCFPRSGLSLFWQGQTDPHESYSHYLWQSPCFLCFALLCCKCSGHVIASILAWDLSLISTTVYCNEHWWEFCTNVEGQFPSPANENAMFCNHSLWAVCIGL